MPSVEETFQQLIHEVGWAKAHLLVKAEAAALRIPADSPRAMRNAIATHRANPAPRETPTQEGLIWMSAIVKLSSKLPGDEEINGLDANVDHFLNDETPVLCLAWVVAKHVTRNIETGDEVPTVEVRRIEPIGIPRDVPQAVQDLAAELYEKRTGRNPLPIGGLLVPAGDVTVIEPISEDAAVLPEPRLNRGPGQIGEIFSFNRPGTDASADA